MKKNLFLVTLRDEIRVMYIEELEKIFGNHLNLYSFSFENPEQKPFSKSMLKNMDAVIIPGSSVYTLLRNDMDPNIPTISLTYTFNKKNIDQLRKYPKDTLAYVGFKFFHLSQATISLLYSLGVNNLNLRIYDDRYFNDIDPSTIEVAIAGDKSNCFPDMVKNIVSLGRRRLSFTTIMDVATILSIMDDELERSIYNYCLDLAEPENCLNYFYDKSSNTQIRLQTVLNCIDDCFIMLNENYMILDFNQQLLDMFHINQNITNLYIETLPELTEVDKIIRSSDTFNHQLFSLDGLNRNILISKEIVPDKNKKHEVIIVLIKDVTKVVNLENSMRKQLAKKGYITKYTFDHIKGNSLIMRECIEKARKIAKIDKPTLITGESGTGKEMFAQSIHSASVRRNFPFIALNCAALPTNLLESELFGYEEGSFTGAKRGGKKGLFEIAHRGTLFLDEIGEMSLEIQAKLLRVLEEKEIMKLGSGEIIAVDVKIIAATNRNLGELVNENKFRLDLFFRLNTIMLQIPTLNERKEDIIPLMEEFLLVGNHHHKTLSQEVLDFLLRYPWRGNVRELRNCAEYMGSISDDVITLKHLPDYMLSEYLTTPRKNTSLVNLPSPAAAPAEHSRSDTEGIVGLLERNATIKILELLSVRNMGRRNLIEALHADGIQISEYKLRGIMDTLFAQSYIIFGKGRSGAILTVKGKEALKNNQI